MSDIHRPRSSSPRDAHRATNHRDRSPHSHRHRRHHHRRHDADERPHKRQRTSAPKTPAVIPFEAPQLSRRDFDKYKGVFASYLDIQKQKDIHDLDDAEIKGRWKSFYQKWNNGELAAGWYDPALKARIDASSQRPPPPSRPRSEDHDSDVDSTTGPAPPPMTFDRVAEQDDARAGASSNAHADLRAARAHDRKLQKAQLEELVPRAEPGTRERMLEKKRETADASAQYRAGREGGGDVAEVGEGELMGSGGYEDMKSQKQKEERKKTEREQRREEIFQARKAEKDERMAGYREKEEKTMKMFRELARERFGGGDGGE